jgi:glycerol-3-phosphate dehydrogenase
MAELSEKYQRRWLDGERPPAFVEDRTKRIERAASEGFDIIVIGGGIHGVCVAKVAAQAGLSVLLLEQGDYASGTSSRSSKMAHGGLRYLEMFDFEQVFEGIRAREALFERLPNLVRPEQFLIPVPQGAFWLRFKLGVGLTIYDLLVRSKARRHKWFSGTPEVFGEGGRRLAGCYQYTDGLMSDCRLVFELLTAAQSCGCCALNYAAVSVVEQQADHSVRVSWRDVRSQASYTSQARLVVNCAGPWAPQLHPRSDVQPLPRVRYSRGSHLVFSVPWRHPSLFLPLAEKGRYYFVWPHPSGTLVGTTEREVAELDADPMPSPDEVSEILERLARDLPKAGLTRETLHYAFAGVRTLPLRSSKKGVSQLSRKHIWNLSGGVLTLLGGKYTTFAWTAIEGVKMALAELGIDSAVTSDALDELPSAISDEQRKHICEVLSERYRVSKSSIQRAVERLGGLVLRYQEYPDAWQEVTPGVLMLEVLHAIECEQAETIEDVVRRRIELEATPSHGKEVLDAVIARLAKGVGMEKLLVERDEFLVRLERIDRLCRTGTLS